jgi:hypothetical protein
MLQKRIEELNKRILFLSENKVKMRNADFKKSLISLENNLLSGANN